MAHLPYGELVQGAKLAENDLLFFVELVLCCLIFCADCPQSETNAEARRGAAECGQRSKGGQPAAPAAVPDSS